MNSMGVSSQQILVKILHPNSLKVVYESKIYSEICKKNKIK